MPKMGRTDNLVCPTLSEITFFRSSWGRQDCLPYVPILLTLTFRTPGYSRRSHFRRPVNYHTDNLAADALTMSFTDDIPELADLDSGGT